MGGESGGEWIHVIYMAGSLCCSLETITTLFVNQLHPNTKFKVFFFFKEPRQPWGEGLQVSGMASAKAWSEEGRGACVRDGGKDGKWGPGQSPAWAGTAGTESHVLLGTM